MYRQYTQLKNSGQDSHPNFTPPKRHAASGVSASDCLIIPCECDTWKWIEAHYGGWLESMPGRDRERIKFAVVHRRAIDFEFGGVRVVVSRDGSIAMGVAR
jgi:hypothetical protein